MSSTIQVPFANLPESRKGLLGLLNITGAVWDRIWSHTGSIRVYGVPRSALTVPPNPIQCNTEQNANLWSRQRSADFERPHLIISLAVLPDGRVYLIDGHTRLYKWDNNTLESPPMGAVDLDVYSATDLPELEHLYKLFDNQYAAKNIKDDLQGAFRKYHFEAKSSLMRSGSFSSALREAYTHQINPNTTKTDSIIEMFGEYENQIRLLDNVGGTTEKFIAPIFVAALITTRYWGVDVVEKVWKPYQQDAGIKTGKRADAIYKLTELRTDVKGKNPQSFRQFVRKKATALADLHMEMLTQGGSLQFGSIQEKTIDKIFDMYRANTTEPNLLRTS